MSTYTFAQIDKMSASEYAAKMNDPEFVNFVNQVTAPVVDVLNPEGTLPRDPLGRPVQPDIDPETGMQRVPRTEVQTVTPDGVVLDTPAGEAIVPPAVPLAVLAEQRYEWQPTDENGRPLGGKQVIIYKTNEEMIQKFTEQNNSILRQMRKLSRDARLGLTPEEDVPQSAPRLPTNFGSFKPKQLTVGERFQLTQDLNDPEKFEDAKVRLAEATFGAKPEVLTETLNKSQQMLFENQVVRSFDEFLDRVGDSFNNIEANRMALTKWMGERNLEPTTDNFEIAFARTAALQIPATVVQPSQASVVAPASAVVAASVKSEPNTQVPTATPSRITGEEQSAQNARRQTPSGLNDRVSSSSGAAPASGQSLTLAEVDKMSPDEYKKRIQSDPNFAKTVDLLQQQADQRRLARQRQLA